MGNSLSEKKHKCPLEKESDELIEFPWSESRYSPEQLVGKVHIATLFGDPQILLQFWKRSDSSVAEEHAFSKKSCLDQRYRKVYMRNRSSREPEFVNFPDRLAHMFKRMQKYEKDCDMVVFQGVQIPVLSRVYHNGIPTGDINVDLLHFLSYPWGIESDLTQLLEEEGLPYYTAKTVISFLEFKTQISYRHPQNEQLDQILWEKFSADWASLVSNSQRGPFFFTPGLVKRNLLLDQKSYHEHIGFKKLHSMLQALVVGDYRLGMKVDDLVAHVPFLYE